MGKWKRAQPGSPTSTRLEGLPVNEQNGPRAEKQRNIELDEPIAKTSIRLVNITTEKIFLHLNWIYHSTLIFFIFMYNFFISIVVFTILEVVFRD